MPRPRLLLFLLCVVWFAFVLYGYHVGWGEQALHGLPLRSGHGAGPLTLIVLNLLMLAVIVAAARGLGALAMRWFPLGAVSPRERGVLETGMGLGVMAMAIFMLAAAQVLSRLPVLALLTVGLVSLVLTRQKRSKEALENVAAPPGRTGIILMFATCVAGLATLGAALAPPEFYDALIYHLAVPSAYIAAGGMVGIEGNYYSHFPANMGMLYLPGLMTGGGTVAQLLHWFCGVLATAVLITTTARHFDRLTAWTAGALFALTPGVMLVSTYAISDLAVVLFGLLCFACVLNHWQTEKRVWLVAAGLFAGFALGTKYTAGPVVILPAALAIALRPGPRDRRIRRGFAEVLIFSGLALMVFSPWLVRNVVVAGNPVAPYFDPEAASPGLAEEMSRRLPEEAGPMQLVSHYLSAPWNVTAKRLGAGGYLSPAFLLLVPLLLLTRDLPRAGKPVLVMALAGLAAWAVTTQVTRYLMPVLGLFAILAAMAARRIPRILAVAAITWSLVYGLFLYLFLVETIGSYRVVTGSETREDFLARRVNYYAAAVYINTLPTDVRILFIGEGRTYYVNRDVVASTPFDRPAIERYDTSGDEETLMESLRADGVTHILVSGPELRRTRNVSADELLRRYFPSGLRLLFEAHDIRLYRLP